jgi:hypothetical protein
MDGDAASPEPSSLAPGYVSRSAATRALRWDARRASVVSSSRYGAGKVSRKDILVFTRARCFQITCMRAWSNSPTLTRSSTVSKKAPSRTLNSSQQDAQQRTEQLPRPSGLVVM